MYRENIFEVMEKTGASGMLVVPKNTGLKGYAWQVLKEAGLDLEEAKKIGANELSLRGLTVLLRRGEDIPQIVMDYSGKAKCVLGVTGDDLLDEYRLRNPDNILQVENTYDWYDPKAKFLRPALSFMSNEGDVPAKNTAEAFETRVAINSKYEYLSRLFLQKSPRFNGLNLNFSLKIYSGDLEDTVNSDANDCCIDTVYTGKTIEKSYRLKIIEIIRFTDLVVVSPLRKYGPGFLEKLAAEIPKDPIIKRRK